MLNFVCPQCGEGYELGDEYLGQKVECYVCHTRFLVPRNGEAARFAPPKEPVAPAPASASAPAAASFAAAPAPAPAAFEQPAPAPAPAPAAFEQPAPAEVWSVACPVCDSEITYTADQAGMMISCPVCSEAVSLPEQGAAAPAPAVSASAAVEQAAFDPAAADNNTVLPGVASQFQAKCASSASAAKSYISNIFDILMQKGHRLLFGYVVINACFSIFILGLFISFFTGEEIIAMCAGFVLYVIWLVVALSPLGEAYLRFDTGCKEFKRREDLEFITPIFNRVFAEAKQLDPNLPNDISIFINESKAPNAFAVGRKSICVTKGLIHNENISEQHIEAVLAHEFGHLSHKDTDILLLLNVGNVIQNIFFKFLGLLATLFTWFLALVGVLFGAALSSNSRNNDGTDAGGGLGFAIGRLLHIILEKLIALYWYLAHICMMRASRNDEFKADEFAFNTGHGVELCAFLDWLEDLYEADEDSGPMGFFAFLESSHPATDDRIAHMQDMGAAYHRASD